MIIIVCRVTELNVTGWLLSNTFLHNEDYYNAVESMMSKFLMIHRWSMYIIEQARKLEISVR